MCVVDAHITGMCVCVCVCWHALSLCVRVCIVLVLSVMLCADCTLCCRLLMFSAYQMDILVPVSAHLPFPATGWLVAVCELFSLEQTLGRDTDHNLGQWNAPSSTPQLTFLLKGETALAVTPRNAISRGPSLSVARGDLHSSKNAQLNFSV